MGFRKQLGGAVVSLALCLAASGASAQDGALSIELNSTANLDEGGCRIVYVAVNGTGRLLDKASFEVVIFDTQGTVGQWLVFPFGRLLAGKTKVVPFELAGENCAGISRLLVNDISECVAEGEESTICIDALKTTTRTSIAFGL